MPGSKSREVCADSAIFCPFGGRLLAAPHAHRAPDLALQLVLEASA